MNKMCALIGRVSCALVMVAFGSYVLAVMFGSPRYMMISLVLLFAGTFRGFVVMNKKM